MSSSELLVLDFDGVIVDGMKEYWWSARKACLMLLEGKSSSQALPPEIPPPLKSLRPWVHHGWEMVLIAAELSNSESQLCQKGSLMFAGNYSRLGKQSLCKHDWNPRQLQDALETIRKQALKEDREGWLGLHQPFPGVIERLRCLISEGIDLVVLTTKGTEFASELLHWLKLKPKFLYGHEAGSKTQILLQLAEKETLRGFIEDRRATLEKTIALPSLNSLPCYLAAWGYLKPNDIHDLPEKIQLLNLKDLANPLAMWP